MGRDFGKVIQAHRAAICVAAALVAVCIPFRTLSRPQWDVIVVDDVGVAMPGEKVVISFYRAIDDRVQYEELRMTDGRGMASFEQMWVRGSLLTRVVKTIREYATYGVHASTGPLASVRVVSSGRAGVEGGTRGIRSIWTGGDNHRTSTIVVPRGDDATK